MNEKSTSRIALERINILFKLAKENYNCRRDLSRRYVELAKKIAMRSRIRMPENINRQICKKCYTMLIPSVSSLIRIKPRREPHISITCLNCGAIKRIPLKKRSRK